MAEPTVTSRRNDKDIAQDIQQLTHTYPPLSHDRHRIKISVEDGAVTLEGHVKAIPTWQYLVNNLDEIPGVQSVDASGLFSDEHLRREIGGLLPYGVKVVMEYGAAILTGRLPEGTAIEDLVRSVAGVKGVHRVITALND